jgi:hypothetical protein
VLPCRRRIVQVCSTAALLLLLMCQPAATSWLAARAVFARQPQPEAPLPDVDDLIRDVRAGLRTDEQLMRQYTFREKRQDVKVTKLGKLHLGPWREFEVYPSPVSGETYKRLISIDGRPLPADELARRDEAHRKTLTDRLAQIQAETPEQRRRRLTKLEKERREEERVVDDVFAVYEIRVLRRELLDGRPTIVTSLTPRRQARTRSDAGRFLEKVRGTAWVNETDRQVVRVEMEAVEDITFGFGLLARMHKGSTVMFRRTRVNDEIWLPAEAQIKAVGKTLIFRKFALETTTRYSDYRKFDVSTSEEVAGGVR